MAIAWTLRHPAVDGAIVGLRTPEQGAEILGGAGPELSAGEVEEIEAAP